LPARAAQAACISAVQAPEAIIALQASALIAQPPEAAQAAATCALFFFAAEAAVAVVADFEAQQSALAVFTLEAFVPQDEAFAAEFFAASQAKAALAHQAVAAVARARSRNSFMSNLPERWGGADLASPTTPEASARVRESVLVGHAGGVSEVQKLPRPRGARGRTRPAIRNR